MGLVTTTKEPPRSALGSTLRAVRSEFRGGSAIEDKADDLERHYFLVLVVFIFFNNEYNLLTKLLQ